jgi:hypothetical protein
MSAWISKPSSSYQQRGFTVNTDNNGRLTGVTFFGSCRLSTKDLTEHAVYVRPEMLEAAQAEINRLLAEKVSALVEERDALREELEALKESTQLVPS